MMVDAGVPLIAVGDDGIGFDAKSSRGLGLLGMEERLLVGGDLGIASQPGMGTTASAEIPRCVRNSVCGVSKSRPTRSDYDKEIAKLEGIEHEAILAGGVGMAPVRLPARP